MRAVGVLLCIEGLLPRPWLRCSRNPLRQVSIARLQLQTSGLVALHVPASACSVMGAAHVQTCATCVTPVDDEYMFTARLAWSQHHSYLEYCTSHLVFCVVCSAVAPYRWQSRILEQLQCIGQLVDLKSVNS